MSTNLPAAGLSWRRSRYGFAGFGFLSLLAAWFLLRLVLFLAADDSGAITNQSYVVDGGWV